jgi:hypothetical protein
MYSVLNCQNVAKHVEFYAGWLLFNVTSNADNSVASVRKETIHALPNIQSIWTIEI